MPKTCCVPELHVINSVHSVFLEALTRVQVTGTVYIPRKPVHSETCVRNLDDWAASQTVICSSIDQTNSRQVSTMQAFPVS